MKYNILATTDQISVSQACSELWMNLRAAGDEEPKVNRARVRGLILAYTNMDPVEAVHGLREHMTREPDRYKAVYRVMPITKWIPTDIERIVAEVKEQASRMSDGESFRITLEKRRTQLRSQEFIDPVAAVIDNPVNLENPDWVVLVQVLGNETGVSVVKPEDILNIQKERYALLSKGK
ncbi:MAG: THUMP domain-containing protein [Candidatus Bathyarchaeota archaeon]|nr:THUMP domain-containing protein [Candidatus Bathyarchaeota archaeon]